MELNILREWLIQKGVDAEYLDQIEEAPVIRDIGDALVMLLDEVDQLKAEIEALKGGGAGA